MQYPNLRTNDRLSYRCPTDSSWRKAKVLHVKPIGVIAVDLAEESEGVKEKAIVRLDWDEVFPPF